MNSFYNQLPWIEANFVEIQNSETVVLDLKYATSDNFVGKDVYDGFNRCFLSKLAAEMFRKACSNLEISYPNLQFHIWDALRPRSVQTVFYNHLKDTPFESYVAKPYPGSLHNFGMAIDLTLQERGGENLDMGTEFDDFRELAQPKLEGEFLKSGLLSETQYRNRKILRDVMEAAGFTVLAHEWWHFNALPREQVHGIHISLD